jgi:hypothetical protein
MPRVGDRYWVGCAYLLEGRPHTLLQPEATALRLGYTLTANVLIGTGLAGWFLRRLSRAGVVTPSAAGFSRGGHAVAASGVGAGLGLMLYGLQGPPTWHPLVLLNGVAQVWPVSVAEVLVCWAVVGVVCEARLRARGAPAATVMASVAASALFGGYHVAHSPPFNTLPMVLVLSAVGLATSLFFLLSCDLYGTVVFHTWLALFGVLRALREAGALQAYERLSAPLLATALVSLGLLIAVHWVWLMPAPPEGPHRPERRKS